MKHKCILLNYEYESRDIKISKDLNDWLNVNCLKWKLRSENNISEDFTSYELCDFRKIYGELPEVIIFYNKSDATLYKLTWL